MKRSEKNKIIEVFEKALEIRERNYKAYGFSGFLCHNINDVQGKYLTNRIGLVMKYFISQRPTKRLNKKFYNSEFKGGHTWWDSEKSVIRNDFLRHLIKKLKK